MTRKSIVVLFAVFAAACATAPQQIPAGGVDLSDEEIAAILRVANQGEIDQGQVASSRAASSAVREFGQMMVREHTNALTRASEAFARAGITPRDNSTSTQLQSGSRNTVQALNTYSGAAFDRNYVRTQVEMHDWLLRSIDSSLLPSARSPHLIRLLRELRPSVAAHLEHARRLQQGM